MKLELTDLNNGLVYLGDKLNIKTKFKFEEDTSIQWSGLKLITNPPCLKELQIAKAEIFSKGKFEAGEYVRERSLLIKNNVIPTIKKRNVGYTVQMVMRQQNPINSDDYIEIKKDHDIEIKVKESQIKPVKQNPVSFSMSGLNILLTKDVFKPGEAIKFSYNSEGYKEIEVRLLQSANIICYCEAYGQNCRKVEELPPAIAGDVKTTNTEEGFMLLKVPDIAEPTHNYLWEPTEKEFWGFKYGDYTKWSILVIGKPKSGREVLKFEIPITIAAKPVSATQEELDLFSGGQASAPSLFDGISSKFQKTYKVSEIESDLEKYMVRIKNISDNDLKGVTVKISGLQEGIFETASNLVGFEKWKKGEEKEIVYETKQNISALITILEDNSQRTIRLQTPVAADFF
ncbi:MAG: hypothetical protein EU535_02285 [Promethearchaeota archaeon]|nr:MAG: hypothetical protein EU535_02285 [Candidatus Lokiarchaeota archaeon]